MTDFKIDEYEITVSISENGVSDADESTIKSAIYPNLNTVEETSSTVILEKQHAISLHKDESENLIEWVLKNLTAHKTQHPTKIAIVEEIGETRCVTYEELVDGYKRAANFMSHHGIKAGDRILMCMENSVEYVLYQLGVFYLKAVPVFVNPSHIASDQLQDIGCTSAIVDFEHYGHALRVSKESLQNIQRIFVLADDIAAVNVARHVWIIDAFGYLSFSSYFVRSEDPSNNIAFVLPECSQHSQQYIGHTQESALHICKNYFQQLFEKIETQHEVLTTNHLITSGFYSHDAFIYFLYVIVKGETCLLAESTLDVWRASFLDRIAGIIEQYQVSLLLSNSQMLRCFMKYEMHKIYNMSSLKLIANHGSVISQLTAKKIRKTLNVILIQAYSRPEFGVASYGVVDEDDTSDLINCGSPVSNMNVKIAHLENEKEVKNSEWGQIILSGPQLFATYLGRSSVADTFVKSWFKTGDYGMIDEKGRLHVEGAVTDLILAQGKQVSSELMETVISQHKMVEDAVVMQNGNDVWCGVLLKNEQTSPTSEKLEKVLKKHNINIAIRKVIVLDFIPRSENGKVIRKEIPYLMRIEPDANLEEENTETSL